MLTFSGFNGFGQFSGIQQRRKVTQLTDIQSSSDLKIAADSLIAPSWSYNALANGSRLTLRGFLSSLPNNQLDIELEDTIKQLSSCDRFCLILLNNGKIYKMLPQIDATPQEIKLDDVTPSNVVPQKRSIFGERRSAACFQITNIACGTNIAVAVSNSNAVYSIPSKIHQFPTHLRVKQLACGFEHALLLSANGDVYCWGNGLRGQLGQNVLRIEEAPILNEALAGIKITFIAAGGWHSAAISAFGDLYMWGFNSNGQLGHKVFKLTSAQLKEPAVFILPQIIKLPKCCKENMAEVAEGSDSSNAEEAECAALKVFTGARHTILQMECGAVYAVGWNGAGQLALLDVPNFCDAFKRVERFKISDDSQIICGPWCTLVLRK